MSRYVFCVGMFRSCSTWQYEVASHLVESRGLGKRLGFLDDANFESVRKLRESTPEAGVLKAHDHHPIYEETIESHDVRLIYAHRDIRDVAYSYMHKAKLDFDDMMAQGFLYRVLENDDAWRSYPGVLVQAYDLIVSQPARSITDMAKHLGISLESGEAARIAGEYSWDENYWRMIDFRRRAVQSGVNLDDPSNAFEHDPTTLLHWNHLREDEVKSWQELSSENQRKRLAAICSDWLIEEGYESDDSWIETPVKSTSPRAFVLKWLPITANLPIGPRHLKRLSR